MRIRTKNRELARLRKRKALTQTLRRELLRPLHISGQPRQLAIDAAHRQPSGPRRRVQPVIEPKELRSEARKPVPRRPHSQAQIISYGAAAVANGSRIVRVDAGVDLRGVQEGDRFGVDAMGRSATFEVISVGFRPGCIEIDRPLPLGRYGWSVLRDRGDAQRKRKIHHPAASSSLAPDSSAPSSVPASVVPRSAAVYQPPSDNELTVAPERQDRDRSSMRFDGKTRVERHVPRDPHLSNEANQLDGNEATFAFWLNRSATVVRPETLMLAVDDATEEAFTIELRPAAVRSTSKDAPFRFVLEVTPNSGSGAHPVCWMIEHPRSANEWQFIAVVTDREGGVTLWLDARPEERQQATQGIASHDYLSLGDGVVGQGTAVGRLAALIPTGLRDTTLDSFAVWSRSLSRTELQRAMSDSPLAATQDGSLQLYWRLAVSSRAPVARMFQSSSNACLPSNLVLDASGTLRHGARVTGLQSRHQDWKRSIRYDASSGLAG